MSFCSLCWNDSIPTEESEPITLFKVNWEWIYKNSFITLTLIKKKNLMVLPDAERLEMLGTEATGFCLCGAGDVFGEGVGDALGCAIAPADVGDLAPGRPLGWTEGGEGSTGIAPGAGGLRPGDSKLFRVLGAGIGDLLGEGISPDLKLGDGGEGADGETTSEQINFDLWIVSKYSNEYKIISIFKI